MAMIVRIFPSTFYRTRRTPLGREALQLCTMGAQSLEVCNLVARTNPRPSNKLPLAAFVKGREPIDGSGSYVGEEPLPVPRDTFPICFLWSRLAESLICPLL